MPTTELLKFSSDDLFWLFLFLSYSFGVKKTNTFIRSCGNGQNLYPFSETIPFGAAHAYEADIGEYPPSRNGKVNDFSESYTWIFLLLCKDMERKQYIPHSSIHDWKC